MAANHTIFAVGGSPAQADRNVVESHKGLERMVQDTLRNAILNGTLSAGQRLEHGGLAEVLGVSRGPVRTALVILEHEGLVESEPYRGAKVRGLSSSELDEIYSLRALLECEAIRVAMGDLLGRRISILRGLAELSDAAADGPSIVKARNSFYREVYNTCGSSFLFTMISQLRNRAGRYSLRPQLPRAGHRHIDFVNLIACRDVSAAEAWLKEHLAWVRSQLAEANDEVGEEGYRALPAIARAGDQRATPMFSTSKVSQADGRLLSPGGPR